MGGKRQNIQYSLALDLTGRGESPLGGHQGTEPPVAKPDPESPALAGTLAEAQSGRTAVVRTRMPGGVGGAAP